MNGDNSPHATNRTRLWLLAAIATILVGWALHATATVAVPVAFSVFMALLVAPLDRRVKRAVPDKVSWLGHAAAMGAILVALLIFVGMIWVAAQQVVERFPMPGNDGDLLPEFGGELEGGSGSSGAESSSGSGTSSGNGDAASASGETSTAGTFIDRLRETFSGAGDSLASRVREWASGMATDVLRAAGTTLFATVLVFFLTLIMLIEGPKWRQKMVNVLEGPARGKAVECIDVISDLLCRYLIARTVLGAVTAALYVGWLWIFGIDLLVAWALLAFLLNYIPTVGSLVAGVLPVAYAFVQKDLGTAFAVGAGIFVIEQIMGNYVDPRVQGRQVSLSSLVVLIALLFWGWTWGIAGAILAVPVTITAMIVCAHVRALRPFALMLSNETDMAGLDRQANGSGD